MGQKANEWSKEIFSPLSQLSPYNSIIARRIKSHTSKDSYIETSMSVWKEDAEKLLAKTRICHKPHYLQLFF